MDLNSIMGRKELAEQDLLVQSPLIEPASEVEMESFRIKKNRVRLSEFPDELPTFGQMPLPVDEHKHIGQYESKQTLYLLLAHAYNKAMKEIRLLKAEINKLKSK